MGKHLLVGCAFLCILFSSPYAQAQEIEVIEVVGSNVEVSEPDPVVDFSILNQLMPQSIYVPGGFGGFLGFTDRGTQTIHTTVYRNGVPANDAGSGWYDFGHDVVTGNERLVAISGPNGVLYGSGSLGGTVFINDVLKTGSVYRLGEQHALLSNTYANDKHGVNFSYFKVNNGSVKTSNDETDWYENTTVRSVHNFEHLVVSTNFTDYSYDYDDCFTNAWELSHDCTQRGNKFGISARNENVTLGYNRNKTRFYTGIEQTWESVAERYYLDSRKDFSLTENISTVAGFTATRETYADSSRNDYAAYGLLNYKTNTSIGIRVTEDTAVYRLGYERSRISFSVGSSYRNPTLYELLGDSFVNSNSNLDPEKSTGYEVSYDQWTAFYYDFSQGIDYDFIANQFNNTGQYTSKGLRYSKDFASLSVLLGYTDSDIARVPKHSARISYHWQVHNYTARVTYTGMFERGIDTVGTKIDDISTFDVIVSTVYRSRYTVSFTIKDALNRHFEVIPGYGAGGRKMFLTISSNI